VAVDTPSANESAIYPVAYAARLVGLDANTARRWARGYAYTHKGERKLGAPVVHLVRSDEAAGLGLTFEELLTLRLVRAFREKGLGLPTIKKAAQVAVTRFGIDNPFVSKAFRSDGRKVFIELNKRGDVPGAERLLVDALTGQQQFKGVVEPSLFRDLVFLGETPNEWFPLGREHTVVLRPDRVFGAPHVADSGIRTDVIAQAVAAEGADKAAVSNVAAWFGLPEASVRDAVMAEAEWLTPKAA
jgi:uncharacterized protein (DUF433 family)